MEKRINPIRFRHWAAVAFVSLALGVLPAAGSPESGSPASGSPAQKSDQGKKGGALARGMRRLVMPFAGDRGDKPAKAATASEPVRYPATLKEAEYVIGAEDVLGIHVWQEPQVSRVMPVRPDGKISLPLIGEIQASGQTPVKLQAAITEALKAYLANPAVTVIVEKVNSQKFNILGEVLRPGSYDLAKRVTVLDAIAIAGGFRDFAKVKDIYVLRRLADGSTTRLPFNYREVMRGRDPGQNIELQAGDTIAVP